MVIALCGYMGSGKSTIGEKLAYKLKYNYFDLDILCENELKMAVKDIFSTYGEQYFRDLETRMLTKLSSQNNVVISLGGGTLIAENNVKVLKTFASIFYIKTSFETCYTRIKKNDKRPIVNVLSYEELKEHYNNRIKIYESSCKYTVVGDRKSYVIVDELLNIIKTVKSRQEKI